MKTINLHIHEKTIIPTLHAKQGDVGRKFKAIITDGTNGYRIPSGTGFSVWYSGASGEGNYSAINGKSAFTVSGNSVVVELITPMLNNKGTGSLCLIMAGNDGSQIGTWNIPYEVEEVPGMGSNPVEQYRNLLNEVLEAAARAERAAATLEIDPTLTVSGQAADSAAVGTALAGKLSEGLYSAEKISVNQNLNTETFWEQVDAIYNAMPEHAVKFVCAYVTNPYPVGEYPHEPAGGVYRVTITRMDVGYGFVEAAIYLADPLGLPTVITRIKSAGVWRDPVKPVDAILARINAATGVAE